MDRRGRIVITAGVVAALVAPVAVDRDGYPLSTYPMYARARGDVVTLATAHGVAADGEVLVLTPGLIGQSDDPLLVAGELREAIAGGRADERCAGVAERLARSHRVSEAVAVEVVVERHDVVARATGEPSMIERTVHARCEVPS